MPVHDHPYRGRSRRAKVIDIVVGVVERLRANALFRRYTIWKSGPFRVGIVV
jgi:hypothetical protein